VPLRLNELAKDVFRGRFLEPQQVSELLFVHAEGILASVVLLENLTQRTQAPFKLMVGGCTAG